MKERFRVLWLAVAVCLVSTAGVAVGDDFAEGCVSCHRQMTGKTDFRLNVLLEQVGHRKINRLKMIPKDCGRCHSDDDGDNSFTAMIHEIHFDVPKVNLFVTRYDGTCIHCHSIDVESGEAGLKNGPKNW
jgi:hypothetical protein